MPLQSMQIYLRFSDSHIHSFSVSDNRHELDTSLDTLHTVLTGFSQHSTRHNNIIILKWKIVQHQHYLSAHLCIGIYYNKNIALNISYITDI